MNFYLPQNKALEKNFSDKTVNRFIPWQEMIFDLLQGAGFSSSRIAYQLKVTSSTIQKLASMPERRPRLKLFQSLLALHLKIFQGTSASSKASWYWTKKEMGLLPNHWLKKNITKSSPDDKWETLTEINALRERQTFFSKKSKL